MTYITPPAPNEKLVAAGTYIYRLNDQPTGVTEPWQVHLRDDTLVTRAARNAPAFAVTIMVEAEQDATTQRFRSFTGQITTAQAEVRARYDLAQAQVWRSVNRQAALCEEYQLTPETVVYPLMRVFLGAVIRQVAAAGQPVPVLTPFLEDPNDTARLLSPTISCRSAKHLATESVEINGHLLTAHRYQFLSPQYDETSAFWLDDNGLLVRYTFHQNKENVWDTVLTRQPTAEA